MAEGDSESELPHTEVAAHQILTVDSNNLSNLVKFSLQTQKKYTSPYFASL